MLECSTRVVDLLIAQLELGQVRPGALGLELKSSTGFLDWSTYSQLCARSVEALGGPRRLAELCEASFPSALPEGGHLMTLAGEPAIGIELMNAFADSSFFTHIRHRIRRTSERTFRVSTRATDRKVLGDATAFFHALEGNLRGAPRFAGLPAATVRTSVNPHSAEYEITLPKLTPPLGVTLRRARRHFVAQCRRDLAMSRATMLEAQRMASFGAVSTTYAMLSAVTAQALAGQRRQLMPNAAVRAVATALCCERVAISRISKTTRRRTMLAATGNPQPAVTFIEIQSSDGVLVIETSLPRASCEQAALRELGPWLALLFSEPPPAAPTSPQDWREARLAELAVRWRLTPRQQQVALLMALGETNKGIGAKLLCAEGTVELHAHAILRKSGLPGRSALAAFFFAGG